MMRWKRVLPFLLLGPVSGPLLAAALFNFREGRPFLGSLYALALVEFILFLPWAAASLGVKAL